MGVRRQGTKMCWYCIWSEEENTQNAFLFLRFAACFEISDIK